jgi:predicted dienelactone hydrolase
LHEHVINHASEEDPMPGEVPASTRPRRPHTVRRYAALLSAVALGLVVALGAAATASAQPSPGTTAPPSPQLTLPAPTGHHRIGTTTLHLVDATRPDPWVPSDRTRDLMVQLWYPAATVKGYPRAPYWPPAVAREYEKQNGLPEFRWPITEGHINAPAQRHRGGWPVVLYSPGAGDPREFTTSLVEDLASHGYVVAAIDHVHDSGPVELPDGRVETSALPDFTDDNTAQLSAKEIGSRVADTSFILDRFTALDRGRNPDHEHRALPRGLHGALDLDHVGMFGHSDGGSTTGQAMHVDPRIKAGFDMDGTFWTPQARAGSDRPLLMFGSQHLTPVEAQSWAELRKNQTGPALQLSLTGSLHPTFTDFAALIPQVAPVLKLNPADLIGTINGLRAVTVERTYLNAWFDTYLRHHHSRLLDEPAKRFPEVQYIP